jgi:alpha-glucosidase
VIAKVAIPFKSPWRTIQIADEAGMLIESSLILNINEPSQMEDASWVRLMKSGEAPVFVINDALTDSVLAHYESLGIRAIRAKFVDIGSMEGQLPGSQARVDQMTRLVEKAAEHKIMVYADETVKASGLERTWPNFICYEGNWYDDLTPGNQVQSTTAGQLAMMVVNFNPYQWIGGLSENYQEDAALSFIRELPVDWDDIRVLNAKIGDYVTIARKKKDAWYLGSVTDENPREFTFTLDFLDEKLSYEMISYADDTAADRLQNPSAYFFEKKQVKKDDEIMVKLATGGGQAAAIRPVD